MKVKEGDEKCLDNHMVSETFFYHLFSSPSELQNIFHHLLSLAMWALHTKYQSSLLFHSIIQSLGFRWLILHIIEFNVNSIRLRILTF